MTRQPDVYTTLGRECGRCGHRHPTVQQVGRCLEDYRRREFSDRIVVAVAVNAPRMSRVVVHPNAIEGSGMMAVGASNANRREAPGSRSVR